MKQEILSPDHKLWQTLCQRLDEQLFVFINDEPCIECQGDLTQTIKILRSMHNINVEGTIALYQKHGGYCDCEVLSNVGNSWKNR